MDFSLSEEQSLLKDSVNKYIANDYSFQARQKNAASGLGFSQAHWSSFADLGWLSVPFPDTMGGYGGKVEDTAVLFEAFGRGLVLEPYLANVILAGRLFAQAEESDCVASIIEGRRHYGLAALERQSRQNYFNVSTTATRFGDGYTLNGTKVLVINGEAAQTLLVTARTAGEQFDRHGLSIFTVDAAASGISKTVIPMMDGSRVANIEFKDVKLTANSVLGDLNMAAVALGPVLHEARIALSAEAVGIIDLLCDKTVEYAQTRTQFDVAIGSFQALQHRMVDMLIAREQSRSILYRAICEYQQGDASAPSTIAAMKALIGRNGRLVGEEAIQLHGGMGMTDELDIGHYVKRLMLLNQLFGDADASLRAFCTSVYAA